MANRRTDLEREADLTVVADLYRRSWSMRRIAEEISKRRSYALSHVTIKNDLDEVLSRWQGKQEAYITNFKVAQLEQLREMKSKLWEDYLKSGLPSKKIKEKRTAAKLPNVKPLRKDEDLIDEELEGIFSDSTSDLLSDGEVVNLGSLEVEFTDLSVGLVDVEQSLEVSENTRNPAYLKLVLECMDREAKILGFYKTEIVPTAQVIIVNTPKLINPSSYTDLIE